MGNQPLAKIHTQKRVNFDFCTKSLKHLQQKAFTATLLQMIDGINV